MAASVNDKFSKVSTGVRPTTTTVASIRSVAGTSLICDDLTGWDTDAAVHFSTYQLDGQGDVVAGTQTDMKGTVSGNTISNIVITGGTDTGNAVGDIVQQLPTARYAKDLADGLLVSLDQDGTLKDNAVVTANITDANVTTAKIADSAVTPVKRSGGFAVGTIPAATLSTTGNKAITGVGFTPKLVRFNVLRSTSSGATVTYGMGAMSSSNQYVTMGSAGTSTVNAYSSTSNCVGWISAGAATSTPSLLASYVSMDEDGFTINVSTASGVYDVAYEAYA